MNKKIEYKNNTVTITYKISNEEIKTLQLAKINEGIIFENRDPNLITDMDDNQVSWKVCDNLVSKGFLVEDEESYYVCFDITEDGLEILKQISKEKNK